MSLAERFLVIRRDPHSEEVLARGGDQEAHSILQRTGFVHVHRRHESYHRVPTGLAADEETRLAADAVARLRAVGYPVHCSPDFDTDSLLSHYEPVGSSVAHLAERIRQATTTDEVAGILVELTAPADGILDAIKEVLGAAAEFHDGLGGPQDQHTAARLRHLSEEHLPAIRADLGHTRTDLADRHAPHPGRTVCTQEVPDDEHERSAVCACPPAPRTLPIPPPPAAGRIRR
ncbi:conserved protein of unknown function [Streptomyces murinus]|uniref:hypothetical protein n=1 Tax=Streptomyces murinus TaxID=33900 RepID=UPI003D67C05F